MHVPRALLGLCTQSLTATVPVVVTIAPTPMPGTPTTAQPGHEPLHEPGSTGSRASAADGDEKVILADEEAISADEMAELLAMAAMHISSQPDAHSGTEFLTANSS